MNLVEDILAVLVGQEMSAEELAEVTGGLVGRNCPPGSIPVDPGWCVEV